jgi:hypothetical protein
MQLLKNYERVQEVIARRDWALVDKGGTVHDGGPGLEETVPMLWKKTLSTTYNTASE